MEYISMDGAVAVLRQVLPFTVAALLTVLMLLEQLAYIRKKGPLPGPPLVVPFIGSAAKLASNPAGFFDEHAARAKASGHGLSADYLFGRFVVAIRDNALSHEVFSNVRPDGFHPVPNIFGIKLFGENDVLCLFDQEHKERRRWLARSFKPRTLATYLALQQGVMAKHMHMWLQAAESTLPGQALKLLPLVQDMVLETSLDVFARPYLSEEVRHRLVKEYKLFSTVPLSIPVNLPGFALHRALRGMAFVRQIFTGIARDSRARMGEGEEPSCLIDFWMQEVVKELDETATSGASDLSDERISEQVSGLLFASKDTTASALGWSVALLAEHPNVSERLRTEISTTWKPESEVQITPEMLLSLRYTHAVAKESLRVRPPTEVMTHIANKPFQLSGGYIIPQGSLVLPTIRESSFQGFPLADQFDPTRFLEPRNEDQVFKKYLLTFGAGAHQCVGQSYAHNLLVLFIVMFVSLFNFERPRSEGCDERQFIPVSAPKDECAVFLRSRRSEMPDFN